MFCTSDNRHLTVQFLKIFEFQKIFESPVRIYYNIINAEAVFSSEVRAFSSSNSVRLNAVHKLKIHFTSDHNFCLIPALKTRVNTRGTHNTGQNQLRRLGKPSNTCFISVKCFLNTPPGLLNLRDPACVLNESKHPTSWHLGAGGSSS